MSKTRRRPIEELDKRLSILRMEDKPEIIERLAEIKTYNEFKAWAVLKLAGLSYLPKQYLNIINKRLRQEYGKLTVVYIDLFAGSGLNKIKGYDKPFLGSPLLVIDRASRASYQFDKLFFVDKSREYIKALEERIKILSEYDEYSWIKGRCFTIPKDANEAAKEIASKLNKIKYKNCLIFIDPYKWQIKRDSLERLLEFHGDVLITLQALLIAKEIGKHNSSGLKEETVEKISEFFGMSESRWRKLSTEDSVKEEYIKIIKEHKPFVVDIKVKSGGLYRYYLIFASKRSNPPWKNWILRLKNLVESFSGDIAEHCIERMYGRASRLDDYFKKQEKKIKTKTKYTTLDNFLN